MRDLALWLAFGLAAGLALPSLGGLPTQITARYSSSDINNPATVDTTFEVAPTSAQPDIAFWKYKVAGRVFAGQGDEISLTWDGLDSAGRQLPPGRHMGVLTGYYQFTVGQAGGGATVGGGIAPPRPCQSGNCVSVENALFR